jgi:hypothetical protein
MMYGTDDYAAQLVRNTISRIAQTDPKTAEYLARTLKVDALNGLHGLLDDFSTALSSIATAAAPLYTSSLAAKTAQNNANAVAQAEAARMQTQLATLQAQTQNTYAAASMQAQNNQLQQYLANLKAGTTNNVMLLGGVALAAFIVLQIMGKKSARR